MTERSTLRAPLLSVALILLALVAASVSAFTLLARGTFTESRLTDTLPSGWVAVGVRAPQGAGGVVTVLPVGGPRLLLQPLRGEAATAALSDNDPHALSAAVADQLSRPMAGAVVLDRLAFAGLVDGVGGVRLHLDHALTVHRTDGSLDVYQPGLRRLDGIAAATFALSEPSGARLFRALGALLQALPRDHDRLSGLVHSLGMSMRATVSGATVVAWLESWQEHL